MIAVGQELAGGRENVHALPRGAALAFTRSLVGDFAEELPLGVLTAALIPVITGHRDELLLGQTNDIRISKSEHTAHDAIVSDAAERMAVHLPKQNRLALGGGLGPRLSQARQPGDLQKLLFIGARFDQRTKVGKLLGCDRLDRGAMPATTIKLAQAAKKNRMGFMKIAQEEEQEVG